MFIPILCGQWDLVLDLDIRTMDGDMEDMAVTGDIHHMHGAILVIGDLDGDILATGDLDTTTTTPITMEEEDLLPIMEEETILLTEITIQIEEATAQIEITPLTEEALKQPEITQTEALQLTDKTAFLTTEEALL